MEKKSSMSRVERLHREKVTRYSIRKYSFGAASVAVAALFMFLGNGAVSANELSKQETSLEATTPTLDKTQLESYISEIETKLSNGSYDNKTEESVTVLKADLEAAKATLANATTQAELKTAYNKLVTTANTKLKTKPVEKKETPAVDTTEGKETVGKKAENTEPKSESNSIEHTGSNDARNGKALDKNNAFRADTTETKGDISYTLEYSNQSKKEIYLYNEEDANVSISVNSTAGNISSAYVKGGSGQYLDGRPISSAPNQEETDGFGWTYHSVLTETPGPATVTITGKPNERFKALPPYTKQESQDAVLGSRFMQIYDAAGGKIEAGAGTNGDGYFRLVVKSQTYKYSIKLPESNADKIAVSNIDSLTEADIAKIKEKISIQYSDKATTQDARLASKKGEVLADKSSVLAETDGITVANGTVTVTYKDGSVDTTPVADVARTNEKPTVEFPYSDAAKREIYVYGAEENSFDIKIKDDADKISRATLLQGGKKAFNPVADETDKINTQYGYTANVISTETPATEANPAVIRYSGTPKAVDGLSQDSLDAATKGETPQGLVLGWRYVAVTDVEGTTFVGSSGKEVANDSAFRVMLKPQTQKYDVTTPENEAAKFPVVDANNVTDAEFKKLVGANNANIKLHYSKTNTDANLVAKQGQNVDDKADKIKSVEKVDNNMVVTYNDGSTDTLPLTKFARTNAAPTVEIPYSVDGKKDVYVYANEDFEIPVKFTDDSGKIKSATILQGGNNALNPVDEANPNVINNEYGTTFTQIDGETGTTATEATPAIVKITGKMTKETPGLTASRFPTDENGEYRIVTRYATSTDMDGGKIANGANGNSYAKDPGAFTLVLKSQAKRYEISDVAEADKVAVADPAAVTDDEFNSIKEKVKIEFSKTNEDKNLESKRGQEVTDKDSKIDTITKDGNNLVVTYKDGSKDVRPLTDFTKLDKQPAIDAVNTAATEKIAAINATPNATDEEKAAAIAKVNADKTAALTAINDTTTKTALDTAKNAGTSAIAADNPVVAKKDAAKADVEAARKAKEDAIKADTNLSEAEKTAAIAKNNTAAAEATKAIDSATTNDAVDQAKTAGTGEIAKVNPVGKELAKEAVTNALADKEKAIEARTDLTPAEKKAAKDKAKELADAQLAKIAEQPSFTDTPAEATTAQTAVNNAEDKGIADVTAVNPVAKEAAKKDIADQLATKNGEIDDRDDLTDEEKATAKAEAKKLADAQLDEIAKQPDNVDDPKALPAVQKAVDDAGKKGVADVTAVNPVAKEAAKKAIADELAEKEKVIDGRTDLTDEEKAAAKAEAKKLADAQLAEIAKQPSNAATPEEAAKAQTAVDTAKKTGVDEVSAVNPAAAKKPAAKKAVEDALKDKVAAIDAREDLTPEEKQTAKDKAAEAAKKATDAIDAATTDAAVDTAQTAGTGEIAKVNPVAKTKAKDEIAKELAEKEKAIDARTDLTKEEKDAAKKEAQDKAKEATDAINKQPDIAETPEKATEAQTAVDGAKDKGVADVKAVNPAAVKKTEAKQAIDDALTAKNNAIDARTDLTDAEKKAAKDKAAEEAKKAKEAIDAATTDAAVDKAKADGTTAVANVTPVAKAEAKKAINDALTAKNKEIDARTDLTDEEKTAAKNEAKDKADAQLAKINEQPDAAATPTAAKTAQDAVDAAKKTGVDEVTAVNPVAVKKPAAKKAIDDALKAKEAAIDARPDLTDEEKKAAKDVAKDAADKAKEAIDAAPSNAAVDAAKKTGVDEVAAVNPEAVKKPAAKKAIDDALKAKEAAIDARPDLTDDEKKAAKDAAKDAADKAKAAVDAATTDAAVDAAKKSGVDEVAAVNPEAVKKPAAKKAIDDALKAKEAAIDARPDLTDDEKKAAKEEAKAAADKAKAAVDAATTDAAVDAAKETGTGDIAKVNPVAKEAAKKVVADELAKKEEEIAGRNDLTDEEKAKAKEEAQAKAKEATDEIDAQPSNAETPEKAAEAQKAVDAAKKSGVDEVAAVNPEAKSKPEAKKAIDDALKAKEAAIDARPDLTDDEKKAAKEEAKAAADKAKAAVDAATTDAAVDAAKETGTGDIAKVNPVAKEAAKKAVADELAKKEAAIDGRKDLTDEEKAAAKEEAQAKAKEATDAIDAQPANAETPEKAAEAQTAVDGAKKSGVDEVAAVNPEAKAKPAAKKAIEDKLAKQLEDIANTPDATDEEKKVAADAAKALAEEAKEEIDKAGTDAEVKQLQEKAEGEIEKSVPVVEDKPNARKAIDEEATAKKAEIDARNDLTPKAKAKLKAKVDKVAEKSKAAIDAVSSVDDVNTIEEADKAAIKAIGEVNRPIDKVLVKDPSALTDEEKAKILEEVKKVNPTAKEVKYDENGNIEVTTEAGDKGIINPTKLVKTEDQLDNGKGGNDINKPLDKVVVKDPSNLTDEEKAKIVAKVEEVNPDAIVTIDEDGTVSVSTPDGKTAAIPASELVRTKEDTAKPDAGNSKIVKPADKVAGEANDPDDQAKAEEKLRELNPETKSVKFDENGNATVTLNDGTTATIPSEDLFRSEADVTKPNAGNDIVKPADKVVVDPTQPLTDDAKKAIAEKVKAVNPGAEVVVDDKGNATVTTPEGKTAVIPATDLTKSPEDAAKPNAGNDIVKPADKVVVDPTQPLTDDAKKAIEDKVKAVNPGAEVVVDDKGNATVTTPEGKTAVIPATDLTKSPEDAAKPNAGNDIVKPADKVVVDPTQPLSDDAKKAIADKVKAVNPGAEVVVDDKGNATVTTPEGKTAVIPATDLTKSPEDAAKPNAGNDIVKPADKTAVKDPANLTPEEKKAIADKVKAVNPGAEVVVDDKGNATVTTPEGKTAVIPAADLTKDPAAATKPNAGNDIVKPADKTAVKDPANLTPEEKKAIEDKVKAVNPAATVVVDNKGNATVTTPEGKTAVIPAADLTKDPAAATKPNAGNDIVKPADKTAVKDPANLTPEEKKAIEDKVKAVNPAATVVVDDKGNATVTTPEGKTAVIPAADLTKDPAAATKPNAGNDIVKPADKTAVKDPANLTPEEKKAIEDKVKAVNPAATVVVDDKGNATVTPKDGEPAVIPSTDLTKDPAAATKPNAGNDIVKPADKTVVANPEKLTDAEKKAIEDKVKAVNPAATVVVDDKGNATVTTPEGKTAVIPATDLTKSPEEAAKANAGNAVNTPASKVEVKDPAKLTDEEKAKVKEAIEAVNPGAEVVVDEKGNATVTTPEGKTAVIPAADLTKSAADEAKPKAGNDVVKPASKVLVKDPAKLTDEEKAAIAAKVQAVNPGAKVVVDDKGNATVTLPNGNTAVIPASDLTKSAKDVNDGKAKDNAVTPAAKTKVANPEKLTDAEKKAIEDKVKALNPGATVVVDDKGNATVVKDGNVSVIPSTDLVKVQDDAKKENGGNDANTPATKTVVKDPANLTDEEKAKVKEAVEAVNPGSTVVVDDKGNATVTKGDGTVLVIPELDLVIPEDKLTDPTQQNGVNTPATRVLVGDKAKLTADEVEKVKESIKEVNPGATVVVDENGNATVTTPEGKTATIPAAQLVKDAKDVAAKNNGENINIDFEKETVADFNNLTDAEKEAAKAKIKGANADVEEVVFDKAGNATVITKDGKVYTIVAKDIFKQRPYVPSNGGGNNSGNGNGTSGNNGATNTDAKADKAKLEGAIHQLDEFKFDAETAKEANALSADAKKVFANADATQAEVDAMVKRIEGFMAKVASSTDHATPANDQAAQIPAVDSATTPAASNASQATSAQANARKVAKELPNTGTADSTVAMVAAAASALLGLGLAGRRRKEDEEA